MATDDLAAPPPRVTIASATTKAVSAEPATSSDAERIDSAAATVAATQSAPAPTPPPTQVRKPTAAPAASSSAKAPAAQPACDPPFVIDARGVKQFKLECVK